MKQIYATAVFLLCVAFAFAQLNTNPYLSVYYTVPTGNTIRDFSNNRLLVVKDSTCRLINTLQNTSEVITLPRRLVIASGQTNSAWVTPVGALFTVATGSDAVAVYEWRQGQLTLVESHARTLSVSGNYLAWVRGQGPIPSQVTDSLFLKNMALQQVTLVDDSVGTDIAMSKEGMAVYYDYNQRIQYIWQNGVRKVIKDRSGRNATFRMPVADNGKILAISQEGLSTLVLYNGTSVDTLRMLGDETYVIDRTQYSINGGYLAYVVREDGGYPDSWTYVRDSVGNTREAFHYQGGKYHSYAFTFIRALSPNGDVMVHRDLNPSGLYYSPRTGPQKLIANTPYERIFNQQNAWFLSQDTILYAIHADSTLPMHIQPFYKTGLANSSIQFTANDFIQHFSGPASGAGQLEKIKITSLPTWGRLTVKGKTVFWERSNEITRAELDSMKYTPNPGIVGFDVLQWQGSNGLTYTSDAAVTLRVYPILNTPPILRTLESKYSMAGGPDTILIANYPPERWHTEVAVLLDSVTALPVSPNGAFIIDPGALSAGLHNLRVTFWHPLDTISISRNFTVTTQQPLMTMSQQKSGVFTQEHLSISPNPFSQQFTLTGLSPEGAFILSLLDQQGRVVYTQRVVNQGRVAVTVSTPLSKGLYLLNIYDENSRRLTSTIKLLRL
ncbi:Por secretion system C-terminal sorting domain-containing protein [Chitinophaga rupis]|uniref:Por secretion system C-terminal sorting domain-containing protein n=1 Tax=Chitinophaga rupis TaxID=573321 RepID=A0A1H7ZJR1_9BACT|nr:T9SS type A sorting domain-containing protein [Chitinophaga rupis]SEM57768.1 Por secretion system C-terminal sorting domain-containing protein [Chitinophaga rupis]